ncbi:MAG: DUF3179 domain-containing protein [Trueperaceae bacterium]|nr:MAG: DUF3179 domain-containing protein [Trueperaceae bacterium]
MDTNRAPHTASRRPPWPALAAIVLALVASHALAVSEAQLERLRVTADNASIPIDEILSGGPPPQGIPALGFRGLRGVAEASPEPRFVSQEEAAAWLGDLEPVILMRLGGEARLYPLQILTWHEIANDTLGGVPVAVTFCPLCNSALAFDRRVPATQAQVDALRRDGHEVRAAPLDAAAAATFERQYGRAAPELGIDVTFGVSGLLYFSNMLMFDDTTFTLWSQLIGEGLVGDMTDELLIRYPAQIVGFAEARLAEPDALVLSQDTGFRRSYGQNPYVGYDEIGSPAFLFRGPSDGRLAPKERVITVDGAESVAYPFDHLRDARVVHDVIAGDPVVAFWAPGTATALGAPSIAGAADIGAVGLFYATVDGQALRFEAEDDGFVDAATGSVWDVTGRARSGPLEGTVLEAVPHDNTLWFAWAAFRPETDVRRPGTGGGE